MDVSLSAPRSWGRWLTLDRLLTALVFIAIFTMAARIPTDTDSWWHLQSGRWIVENQVVPRVDPFSHTHDNQPWIDHGWLAQILIFLFFDWFGYTGLVFLLATFVTVAFYFAWSQCQNGNRWLRAFVLIFAAITSGIIWAIRPQIVSFMLAAVVAYLLYRYKHGGRRALWLLPPVILLWVNVHGGFAIGFMLMAAYLFGEMGNQALRLITPLGEMGNQALRLITPPSREAGEVAQLDWRGIGWLALVMIICLLVVPLNPNGTQMWSYPFRTVGIGVLQDFIAEWQSPNFHEIYLHPFIWLLLAAVTAFGLAGRRADFTDLTLVALFTYLSLLAVRNVPLFALLTAPVIVRYGTLALAQAQWPRPRAPQPQQRDLTTLNWLILGLVLVAALARISESTSLEANEKAQAETLPAGAVAFLRQEQPPGPLFNDYNWGGYLIWALPEYPVFVDGRTDLYDDEFLRQYLLIYLADEGWQVRLDEYGINLVIVDPPSLLARELRAQSGWRQIYQDEIAVVFTRR